MQTGTDLEASAVDRRQHIGLGLAADVEDCWRLLPCRLETGQCQVSQRSAVEFRDLGKDEPFFLNNNDVENSIADRYGRRLNEQQGRDRENAPAYQSPETIR